MGTIDDGTTRSSEWANRIDLFGNLALTGSERFVFGLRPADQTDPSGLRRFSGYSSGGAGGGFSQQFNFDWDTLTHLFFEGDFGELFPNLDRDDRRGLDLGLSVGRQPISFQDGLLINDFIDAAGVTRNSLRGGPVNLRFTGLYAWNQIDRRTLLTRLDAGAQPDFLSSNVERSRAQLVGGFTEVDWRSTTAAFDAIYVRGGEFENSLGRVRAGDGLYAGVSFHAREVVLRRGLVHLALHRSGPVRREQDVAETAAFRVERHDDDRFATTEGGLAALGAGEAVAARSGLVKLVLHGPCAVGCEEQVLLGLLGHRGCC